VKPVVVVEGHESLDALFELFDVIILLDVDLLIFERSEEAFDSEIVNASE
jgi:hypothetical protein